MNEASKISKEMLARHKALLETDWVRGRNIRLLRLWDKWDSVMVNFCHTYVFRTLWILSHSAPLHHSLRPTCPTYSGVSISSLCLFVCLFVCKPIILRQTGPNTPATHMQLIYELIKLNRIELCCAHHACGQPDEDRGPSHSLVYHVMSLLE